MTKKLHERARKVRIIAQCTIFLNDSRHSLNCAMNYSGKRDRFCHFLLGFTIKKWKPQSK